MTPAPVTTLRVLVASFLFVHLLGCESEDERLYRLAREPNERCSTASANPDLAARKKQLSEARAALSRDGAAEHGYACRTLADEIEALEQRGECPETPPSGVHCTCGSTRYPEDAPCAQSRCGGDVPEGYVPTSDKFGRMLVCGPDGKITDRQIAENWKAFEGVKPCWLTRGGDLRSPALPCRMHADLDGDGKRERVVLVEYTSSDYSERHMKILHGLHTEPFGDKLVADRVEDAVVVESGVRLDGFALFFPGGKPGLLLLPGRPGWPMKPGLLEEITAWSLVEKASAQKGLLPSAAKGDAIRLQGTGMLLYWDGKKLVSARDRGQKPEPKPKPDPD